MDTNRQTPKIIATIEYHKKVDEPWLKKLSKLLDMPMGEMVEQPGCTNIHAVGYRRQAELIELRYQKYLALKRRLKT